MTYLFNNVFSGVYPDAWNYLKVFNIYKKGDRLNLGNYRGISIMPALPVLYHDMVLASRFALWYQPRIEEAGTQRGRGCEEQILVIRLLIEIARKAKLPLYIAYIDYQKAYDKVDSHTLLKMLDKKGCGTKFLRAIRQSLRLSTGIIGESTFKATSGVRQGGCTSCSLFTFFIDCIIEAVSADGPDGWLENIHSLLLMDDTVIFATSRNKLQSKLCLLKQCTDDIGMIIHPTKSQYMTINCNDELPFYVDNVVIEKTNTYVYLGALITNKVLPAQVKEHATMKAGQVIKFSSFLQKNSDAPFSVKKAVWNSVVSSAILCGCETWMCASYPGVDSLYMNTIKQLLGVRLTTCNDLTLIEAGLSDVKCAIQQRQHRFVHNLVTRDSYPRSYLEFVVNKAIQTSCAMGLKFQEYISIPANDHSYVTNSLTRLKQQICESQKTRYKTYMDINPRLISCPLYSAKDKLVPEYARMCVTRLRLSSHHL